MKALVWTPRLADTVPISLLHSTQTSLGGIYEQAAVDSDKVLYCFLGTNKCRLLHSAAAASMSGVRGLYAAISIASVQA